jgi:nitrate reductase delta subunit
MEATRNPPPALALRALARLLDYPAEPLFGHLDELGAALDAAPVKPARRSGVRPLLERLASCDPLDAQELYIDTFDRGRRSSLNLFEHVHGDSRDRGQAMVDLLEMYRAAGVELDTDQLPDYLPAFLEYLSLLPAPGAREHLAEVTHLLRALAGEPPLGADEGAEDDTSFEAIDAAWLDAPVDFMGATAPCPTAPRPATEQPIQFQRRVA